MRDGGQPRYSPGTAVRNEESPVVAAKLRVPHASSLPRERLQGILGSIWEHRLSVVVAPAGSGKTTILADFAASIVVPTAWYRAETWEADPGVVLRHLEAALTAAIPGLPGGWLTLEDAASALESRRAGRALLVIDDGHALEGTAAEDALERFVEYAPRWLAIAIGSRVPPGFNLSRLRVSGDLLEIGPEELRFRAWEVERLFRDYYGDPVPPRDLAVLARRTEGWAAGLQLFHLATRGRSAEERKRILTGGGSSSRLVREYLTWNVLNGLPEELRRFLIDTCMLGRLTAALCDRLLGRVGSAGLLEELFRRQIFTVAVDEAEGSYRYHEVLRSHLDRTLVEQVGEETARARYTAAGRLLEEVGASAEALGAFCRAEDWESVRRLLGNHGEQLAEGASGWLETLPPAAVRHEPWLELAAARRARAAGRWAEALDGYSRAERAFGASAIATTCHVERLTLRAWLDPVEAAPPGWTRSLRAGLVREPLRASGADVRDPGKEILIRGLLALAAGKVGVARQLLADARSRLTGEPALAVAAHLGEGLAAVLAGDPIGERILEDAVEAAERADIPWLARLARAAGRLSQPGVTPPDADAAGAAFDPARDPWGAAIVKLFAAWNPCSGGDGAARDVLRGEYRLESAEAAALAFRRLGAGVAEAWGRSLAALALAETGAPDAREAAVAAESFARATGAPVGRLVAYRALAQADPSRLADYDQLAASVREETGLIDPPVAAPPVGREITDLGDPASVGSGNRPDGAAVRVNGNGHRGPDRPVAAGPNGRVAIRVLGRFALLIDGVPVSVDGIRPRARVLLRLLAVHAGSPVHREVIAEALWPGADAQTAGRSLQVAVSAVRGLFTEALGPDGSRLVVREGDAYRLAVPDSAVDLRRFEVAIERARAARARGESAASGYAAALGLYVGGVLPEDGPEEWVVDRREHFRAAAVEAASEVADQAILGGDYRAAVEACRIGLEIDRYDDALWRLLIDARQRAGDVSAAHRDRRDYEAILDEVAQSGYLPVSAY